MKQMFYPLYRAVRGAVKRQQAPAAKEAGGRLLKGENEEKGLRFAVQQQGVAGFAVPDDAALGESLSAGADGLVIVDAFHAAMGQGIDLQVITTFYSLQTF